MNFNQDRTYGIKIEFYLTSGETRSDVARMLGQAGIDARIPDYDYDDQTYWKLTKDISINHGNHLPSGIELVSPPLKGLDGFNQIRTVCNVLNSMGAVVNKTCGLHVHHDAHDFTLTTFKNLFELYIRCEKHIDLMVAPNRRADENEYCSSMLKYGATVTEMLQKLDESVEMYGDTKRGIGRVYNGRFYKLNVDSYERHGTIEFRQYQGTTDCEKIINWVIFTQSMVTRAHGKISRNDKMGSYTDFSLLLYWRWPQRQDATIQAMMGTMKTRINRVNSHLGH